MALADSVLVGQAEVVWVVQTLLPTDVYLQRTVFANVELAAVLYDYLRVG